MCHFKLVLDVKEKSPQEGHEEEHDDLREKERLSTQNETAYCEKNSQRKIGQSNGFS